MIIGNGLLARAFIPAFADHSDIIVFASGVSNSRENSRAEFEREQSLLIGALAQKKSLVYFSTCSVHDPELSSSAYVRHKMAMEKLIMACPANTNSIFRLPQVVGYTKNPHTLTNYLYRQIANGEAFQLWTKAQRNLIDVTDVFAVASEMIRMRLTEGKIINIACPFATPVTRLVAIFEQVIGKSANYIKVDAGSSYPIETKLTQAIARRIGLNFGDAYSTTLIQKYYA